MLIEMPKQFSKYLGHLCNKFVVDDFQKSPKLVTVITQVELCRVKISYSTLKTVNTNISFPSCPEYLPPGRHRDQL